MPPHGGPPAPIQIGPAQPLKHKPLDPSRLAPEDAIYPHSPSRRERRSSPLGLDSNGSVVPSGEVKRSRNRSRGRSGSRRRNRAWKKLLWVKQSCAFLVVSSPVDQRLGHLDKLTAMGTDPDNYTDEYTFLDHLQRNPRLQPYQFWRLVADSTVIVQHVSTVAIFVCCFTGIFQERVSPVTVVSWGTVGTVIGWVLWDFWVGQEDEARLMAEETETRLDNGENCSASSSAASMSTLLRKEKDIDNKLPSSMSNGYPASRPQLVRATSAMSLQSNSGVSTATSSSQPTGAPAFATYTPQPLYGTHDTVLSPRSQQRISTAKSAILIYCAVLGLSPILKSLTKSTSSDSIWAISFWLFVINVFFFDYGGGVGAKYVPLCLTKIHVANQFKISRFSFNQRCPHGLNSAGLSAHIHYPRLLPDPLFDRSIWPISCISPSPTPHLMACTPHPYHSPCARSGRRGKCYRERRRLDSSHCRLFPWECIDNACDGYLQLVAD